MYRSRVVCLSGHSSKVQVNSGAMRDYGGSGGWIEVVCGVMFSGKSEELMRRVRRATLAKKRVQVFKSHLDERYGGIQAVGSHDGGRIVAEPISNSFDLAE